ncbi:MAG: multicopper oxidase domain-containing protein [Friedmanniella sp.]
MKVTTGQGDAVASGVDGGAEVEARPRLLLPSDPEFAALEEETRPPAPAETSLRVEELLEPPRGGMSRRSVLRLGALGVAGAALVGTRAAAEPYLASRGLMTPDGVFAAAATAITDLVYLEAFPTSPLILNPFSDPLNVPQALRPVSKDNWSKWAQPPSKNQQNSLDNQTHQKWVTDADVKAKISEPIVYKLDLEVETHSFTTSKVLPIDKDGKPTISFDADGKTYPAGTERTLPLSTIYGFNGTFPGPMINAEYGKPALVRFENRLHENPRNLDRQDFGTKNMTFLTHLHNGHTAPESDGNPHYSMTQGPKAEGYEPKMWVDNLYLNWPAGGDDAEKQSFFWFHDHRMDQTGSNVYKGLVGLYPIYDPILDPGDENRGLRLPGVRRDHDGTFDVDYDIPLAFYDCRLDDGMTPHKDAHNGSGETHPEWWGMTYFRHFPNHGFVGDIFTVNGAAYPVLHVDRRRYRLRFLDASISRIYEFKLMTSSKGPVAANTLGYKGDELQGQYRLTDGQQCMKWVQVANEGGLLPNALVRDSFELWPAKRKEFVVDFTKYQDGTPTKKGDVIYLVNTMKMTTGRMWDSADPKYQIPMMKIVIGDDAPDASLPGVDIYDPKQVANVKLREVPDLVPGYQSLMKNAPTFELQRGSSNADPETEWLINGQQFEPSKPLISVKRGSGDVWRVRNGGGGWVHPMHLHMEEHTVLQRNGKLTPTTRHPDDTAKEDVIALDPSEDTYISRRFRTFTGPYVAHCHNLAHEDHNMMFGWEIVP